MPPERSVLPAKEFVLLGTEKKHQEPILKAQINTCSDYLQHSSVEDQLLHSEQLGETPRQTQVGLDQYQRFSEFYSLMESY